jgi:hypothetical protein
MKIAIMASLFAEWYMDINSGQAVCDLMNNFNLCVSAFGGKPNDKIKTANIGSCFP